VVDLDGLPAPLEGPFSATPLPEKRGLALLFRAPDAWVVISPDGRRDVPFARLPPHTFAQVIVNQRGRAWLAVESPLLGPLCVRLDGRSGG